MIIDIFVMALNDTTYAITTRMRLIACGSEVLSIYLCVVFARRAKNDAQREEKYRSAEGRMPTA
jgi:hypothetical protein